MVNKIKLKACPFCATRAIWYKGDKNTRMPDRVQCLGCCVEIEGDYEPMSAKTKLIRSLTLAGLQSQFISTTIKDK